MKKNSNKFGQSRENRKRVSGFTLIEIMVVLFIIVSIAGAAVLSYNNYIQNAKIGTTKQYVETLSTATEAFHLNVGQYPSSLQDLLECPSGISTSKWGGPYVRNLQKADPWQNEYRYEQRGQHNKNGFDVWSIGPDGQDGSEDDIGNW
jgi:general secretion pathway protein G